jgi:serine/threonine protein phosphatase PrpC
MSVLASSARTSTGRKRRRNEDAFVCEPPLFAVADGMGGAQAGEVASRLAAESLREADRGELSSIERTVELIREANRRVFAYSSENVSARGMGTTMTVALAESGRVTIGHVGDSRAYVLRDGRLSQLTQDHSLVAELVRSGRISPEEADSHPQRSVITRALGTDPEVDIDVFSFGAKEGDLFLLCSDGLTSMVADTDIEGILESARSDLDTASKKLIEAANRAGGEDNITVVLFELATETESAKPTGDTAELGSIDEAKTLTEADAVPAIEAKPVGTPRSRRSSRLTLAALAVLVLLVMAGLGAYTLSAAHFIGVDSDGRVAVYQGLPYNLPGGIHLYRAVRVSTDLYASQLTESERKHFFNHDLSSFGDATRTLTEMERDVYP